MVRSDVRTIDELGRIILPIVFRKALCVKGKGDKVNLQTVGSMVMLHAMPARPDEGYQGIEIDELGRVLIPKELLEKMDWKKLDKIAIYNVSDDILALELDM